MVIEAGDANFADAMEAIHRAAFPPGARWSAASFAAELTLPGCFALIDRRGAFLLGRIVADEAEILTLAVHPTHRRRGLGRALVEAALVRARAVGAKRVLLEVSVGNEAARQLYARFGFHTVGNRAAYYADGSDALILAVDLA